MDNRLILLLLVLSVFSCQESAQKSSKLVNNPAELRQAISNAKPGHEIIMANGDWTDVQIRFIGFGTASKPITLRAETPGKVIIQGKSDLKLGGEYLHVEGLHFTNGYSPSRTVIDFAINRDTLANHSQVSHCVIQDFNKPQRNMTDLWVQFKGRHNQLDHCYISGKSNRGPTLRVDLEGNQSIKNYHQIIHNYFGPRPPKGGPSAETIQLGNSSTSMAPSYTLVAHNLFDRCNGEVEIISSKSNFNEFRNNVFYKSNGSLVTRHGNYCIVDGNYFIGDDALDHVGGVRLIGSGHWLTNNYFYKLKGKIFRSPLAVMNGIPKSPLNRYIQVTDVVIAHNSWINCTSPLQFGVGSNIDEKDVLPPSEIRSARPIRTLVANNLIYNEVGDPTPVVAHDLLDGIAFKSNVINNQGQAFESIDGIEAKSFEVSSLEEDIWIPESSFPEVDLHHGFEFDQISRDLFGSSRNSHNTLGAVSGRPTLNPAIMDPKKYGPAWYVTNPATPEPQIHAVTSVNELVAAVEAAKAGDIIQLKAGDYALSSSLKIDKSLSIQSADPTNRANLIYTGAPNSPAFEMNPKGQLSLRDINLSGTKSQYAFASLKSNMSSLYNLTIENCEISDFSFVLKAYKYSFAENLIFDNTTFRDCANGLELSEETDDRGDYNAQNITIQNCTFERITQNVIDYYRGGYDESTIGGNLIVRNSSFSNCGGREKNGILLNTYGIINVEISENKFINNPVKLVALLWGAKNNKHANNSISNSGRILVEENLKLKLVY